MRIYEQAPILDSILEGWRVSLGEDFTAYRHHCFRVLNFCLAFSGESTENIAKTSIAVAFHDMGIWTNNTYDYLSPSKQLARDHLVKSNQGESWTLK